MLTKISFFLVAVVIGAVNLLGLKPRLLEPDAQPAFTDSLAARLHFNILLELVLDTAIIAVVALPGILPP